MNRALWSTNGGQTHLRTTPSTASIITINQPCTLNSNILNIYVAKRKKSWNKVPKKKTSLEMTVASIMTVMNFHPLNFFFQIQKISRLFFKITYHYYYNWPNFFYFKVWPRIKIFLLCKSWFMEFVITICILNDACASALARARALSKRERKIYIV